MKLINRVRAIFAGTKPLHATPQAVSESTQPQNRRKNARLDARKGTRVLIIDNSPAVLTFLGKIFSSAGYITMIAGNAQRGLQIARMERPDLVILDIIMPGINGFAALRHIRRDPVMKDVPVIMMGSKEKATEQFYVNRIGADGFLNKPFSRFDLFSRIERMLDDNFVPRRLAA